MRPIKDDTRTEIRAIANAPSLQRTARRGARAARRRVRGAGCRSLARSEAGHLLLDPIGVVRHARIDAEQLGPGAAHAEADHAELDVVAIAERRPEEAAAVALARVLAALGQAGAQHVVGDLEGGNDLLV